VKSSSSQYSPVESPKTLRRSWSSIQDSDDAPTLPSKSLRLGFYQASLARHDNQIPPSSEGRL
ncbi:unnamed protein product, partial [Hymenolepis diminuta]